MKTKHIFFTIALIATVCCNYFNAAAQGNFTINGKVILGGSGGVGVPNWNVRAIELTNTNNTYSTFTNAQGNYSMIIAGGAVIGPNKRWEVTVRDSCSNVFRRDTVQNLQGTISSATADFELSLCQNNICGIGWQYTQSNQVVTFFNSAFGAANGTTRYFWNFGDGATSTDKNPIHTYLPGRYRACAWVFSKSASNDYCIKFFCDSVIVNSSATCEANFTYSNNGLNLTTVSFDNQSTFPGQVVAYSWDFGDGSSASNDVNPIHTYAQYGTYYVCLVGTTTNGCGDSFCDSVVIAPNPFGCEAAFQAIPVANNRVEIVNNSVSDNPNNTSYAWVWGDGTTGSGSEPIHAYQAAGTYTICMYQYDAVSGCRDTLCEVVQVGNTTPTCNADFSYSPNNIPLVAPATVVLNDSSVSNTPGTGIATWIWKVNGTPVATTQNPSYVFTTPGTYNVCLAITTTNGCSEDVCQQITINGGGGCEAAFIAFPVANNRVEFDNNSVPAQNTTLYYWNYGDNTPIVQGVNPDHTYSQPGVYEVCLYVFDQSVQCYDTLCKQVTVGNPNPTCEAAFNFSNNGLNISTVTFDNNSITNGAAQYVWTFGDGNTSSLENPVHTYASQGTYLVCLKVYTATNCFDEYCQTIVIGNNNNCEASFIAQVSNISNLKFGFTNASVPNNPNSTTYQWSFGDGSSSQLKNPVHEYASAGRYIVCLTVTDAQLQCQDTYCDTIFVGSQNNCDAAFAYGVNGSTVSFDNNSLPAFNTNSYFWNFGDNTFSTDANPNHTYSVPGTYNVCLTMIDNQNACTDVVCQTIVIGQNSSLFCISGKVFQGTPNSPAFPASVFLIYNDTALGTLTAIRFATTGPQGGYEFCNVPQGRYLVKAALTPNSPAYANYVPTYYGNSLFWNYATEVLLNQNAQQIDIWLIAGNNQGGPGFVGGFVNQGANKMQSPDDPLQDIQVMLLDMFDNPVQYVMSDANGRWTFENVAYGTYKVWAEVAGKTTIPYIVTIGEEQPSVDNIQLYVETEQIISGIENQNILEQIGLSIFPNPTDGTTYLNMSLEKSAELQITVTDVTGKTVSAENVMLNSGKQQYPVYLNEKASGVFFVKIEYQGFSKTLKVLKR